MWREPGYAAWRLITLELKLYSNVQSFYTNLIEAIGQAQDSIAMMYFTFDWGDWALKIAEILETKQVAGVRSFDFFAL